MNAVKADYDSIVIGGGFFGSYFAYRLAGRGERVLLIEKEDHLLGRASMINQARIHRGYHYPRSVLTGFRSAVNFARFVNDLSVAVCDSYESYYAIARRMSNITSEQFRRFCNTITAPISPAPGRVVTLFNADLIDSVVSVEEYVFDGNRLREEMLRRLDSARVSIALSSEVARIETRDPCPLVILEDDAEHTHKEITAGVIFICCYAFLNQLLRRSRLAPVPMKYELAEMALIDPPEELSSIAVTVMCGPFFSLMPFPPRGLHTLSHVRYTPHFEWIEPANPRDADEVLANRGRSKYPEMVRDAARYLPLIGQGRYTDSLWEIKALLPQSELNDSRPILMASVPEDPRVVCVLGGKIDNVYDVWDLHASRERNAVQPR